MSTSPSQSVFDAPARCASCVADVFGESGLHAVHAPNKARKTAPAALHSFSWQCFMGVHHNRCPARLVDPSQRLSERDLQKVEPVGFVGWPASESRVLTYASLQRVKVRHGTSPPSPPPREERGPLVHEHPPARVQVRAKIRALDSPDRVGQGGFGDLPRLSGVGAPIAKRAAEAVNGPPFRKPLVSQNLRQGHRGEPRPPPGDLAGGRRSIAVPALFRARRYAFSPACAPSDLISRTHSRPPPAGCADQEVGVPWPLQTAHAYCHTQKNRWQRTLFAARLTGGKV